MIHYYAEGYTTMFIVLIATDSDESGRYERELIHYFTRVKKDPACMNISPGGESKTPGSPHFTYVVFG